MNVIVSWCLSRKLVIIGFMMVVIWKIIVLMVL